VSSLDAVTVGGQVHAGLWHVRVRVGDPVGTCSCGGPMIGFLPRRWSGTRWYEAQCRVCGREVSAPNGKLARKQDLNLVA
jgi:hypothetical protein